MYVEGDLRQEGAFISGSVHGPVVGSVSGGQVIIQDAEDAYDVRGLPNPYLGLRSFVYADRACYAGREHTVAEAVETLAAPDAPRALFFITGASGSGKSSFAQAGLLPALEERYARRSLAARWAVFRPSRHPLAGLADALLQLGLPNDSAAVAADPGRFIAERTPPQQINLLVIDQFEELFTQSEPAQRDALFAILENLPDFATLRTHVIATLRSDYLPELFARKPLYDAAKQGVDLRAMDQGELREAIQRPLQVRYPDAGKRFEAALLDQLAHDAAQDAAYLPLLQVTLEELWSSGRLTLDAYAEPTAHDALARAIEHRAEQVYAYEDYAAERAHPRSEQAQATIIQIFLDLVDVSLDDDARRDVRRRRPYDELQQGSANRGALIEDLCEARLLIRSVERRSDAEVEVDVVDIIHEALISNWDRLRISIAEQRHVLQQRARFEQALRTWLAHERSTDYALTGVYLAEARDLERRGDITLRNPDAQDLLRISIAQREAEQQRELDQARALAEAERERAAAQAAVTQRTRRFAAGLLALLALALAAMVYAIIQRGAAQRLADDLETQVAIKDSQRLALLAQNQAGRAPETALLLAYEAVARDHNPVSEQTLRDQIDAIGWRPITLAGHTDEIQGAIFSPDGRRILSASKDNTARLWDADGRPLATLAGHTKSVTRATFSPDGQRILTASNDQTARLWDLSGRQLAIFQGHTATLESAVFSPDGQRALTASQDHTARLWDLTGRALMVFQGHAGTVKSARFSRDGQRVLTASQDGTARLWDLTGRTLATFAGQGKDSLEGAIFNPAEDRVLTFSQNGLRLWDLSGRQILAFKGHSARVFSAVFSPDGQYVLSASQDGTARLWRVDGQALATFAHDDEVRSAAFSPTGSAPCRAAGAESGPALCVLTASQDGTARLWDAAGRSLAVLSGHRGGLRSAVFAPDGSRILTASQDHTLRLWTPDGPPLASLIGHTNKVVRAVYSPDGQRILTAARDNTARLWGADGRALATLAGHRDKLTDAAFSRDGSRILTASDDGTARLWDADGRPLATLRGHTKSVVSAAFSPAARCGAPDPPRGATDLCILTASQDGTARLWDAATQSSVALRGHTAALKGAVFSPDGRRVLTASDDGTARQYLADDADLLAEAACRVGRGLTSGEAGGFELPEVRFDFAARRCPPPAP